MPSDATVDQDQLAVLKRLRAAGLDPVVLFVSPLVIVEQEEGGQ